LIMSKTLGSDYESSR